MGYRIQMAPEVAGWLSRLRDADPGTAGVVDDALAALRDQGASLGPPLVIPVEVRAEPARPDKAAEAAAEAAARAAEAEAAIEGVIAHAEDPDHDSMPSHGPAAPSARLSLSELRPGTPPRPVHRRALELGDGAVRHGRPARRRDRTRLAGRLVRAGDTTIPDPVRAGPRRYRLTSRSA